MTDRAALTYKTFLCILIGLPALALGSVHPTVQGIFVIVAALFAVFVIRTPELEPPPMEAGGLLLLALTVITIIQIIPLPSALVSVVAPEVFDVRSRALTPMSDGPARFMPLTLDAPLTITEVGKLALYLAVYFGVLSWTRRNGPTFVLRVVAVTGCAAALVFICHRVLLLDKIYGFYHPIYAKLTGTTVSAPLINPNHMAGLLILTTTVAIGSALAVEERAHKYLLIGIAALSGGTLLLTLSRGGIAAFIAGQLLFFVFRLITRLKREREDLSAQLTLVPLGLTLSLGLGMFIAQDAIIGEFVGGDTRKLDMAFESLPLIGRFWPTGVGRGVFGVTFQMVSSIGANRNATHAENAIIQILSDYGIPIGSATIVVSLLIIGYFVKNLPRRIDVTAALAALIAFGIHNLVDFNSEIPGVAVIAVALLGVLVGSRPSHRRSRRRRYPKPVPILVAAVALTTGIAGVTYLPKYNRDDEERALSSAWKRRDPSAFTQAAIRDALNRHPASWFIPYIVGLRMYYLTAENPLPWFARAIEVNPHSAYAHFYVGATFLRAGYLGQTLLEFRLAARSAPRLKSQIAALLIHRVPRFDPIAPIALSNDDKKLMWPALANELSKEGFEHEAAVADDAILKVDPMSPRSLTRTARRLTAAGNTDQALVLAKRLATHPDLGASGIILEAEIHQKRDSHDNSLKILKKGLERFPKNPTLLRALAWAYQRSGDFKAALDTVERLKMSATTVTQRADCLLLEAALSQAEGRFQATLARLREAHALTPWNQTILTRIVDLAEQTGDDRRALEALRHLATERPDDNEVQHRLRAMENRLKQKIPSANDKI